MGENKNYESKKPNELIHETSPYLLQHAYNPIKWQAWNSRVLENAITEGKPIIISIGYSACHWCHVMERESFQNEEVARLMNENFINIKVDREERPDLDQIYMEALQLMNLRGGWPMNVFLTPTGKPFYGGTYFPTAHWIHLLQQIIAAFKNNRKQIEDSAEQFTEALNESELNKYGLETSDTYSSIVDLDQAFLNLAKNFDGRWGGMKKAPKFPMPVIYSFLLQYHYSTLNDPAAKHVKLTLNKMGMGGLYDQAGGGFARYSTDEIWLVPHFEKMLYDNGQLISLYSQAFQVFKDPLYKNIVCGTIEWIKREMTSPEGGFYSALDADSDGEEGLFYVWSFNEIKKNFPQDFSLLQEYYQLTELGNWENDKNILYKKWSDSAFANKFQIPISQLELKVKSWNQLLMKVRESRSKPGLDYKILTSWNSIVITGLIDAYMTFGDRSFLQLAIANASFLKKYLITGTQVYHTFSNGRPSIEGFLDDYAFLIQCFISIYQTTFEEEWIFSAHDLSDFVIENFYDTHEEMFFYNSVRNHSLIARKKEIFDNVIPSSNSVMATNLWKLGHYLDKDNLKEMSGKMLGKMKKLIISNLGHLANWGALYATILGPTIEVAIVGKDCYHYRMKFQQHYLPNCIFSGATHASNLPLLSGKLPNDNTTKIYICYNKTCQAPVESVETAVEMINKIVKDQSNYL